MSDISTVTVNSTTYDIKDAFARPHLVYYVRGTQTASTNLWTGNLPYVDELYQGLTIAYFLPFAGTSTAAKLTLTLKDGTDTGQIPVYLSGKDTISTGQPVNSIWEYVYQTVTVSGVDYTGWFSIRAYDTNSNTTDIVNLYQGSAAYQANSAVYCYQLLFQMNENELTPLNNNSNATGTTKTMLTNVEFDPFGYVFYWNSTTTVSAGGNMTTSLFYQRNTIDLRYTFNCGQTLTAHKMIYLKLSLQSNGKVKIASDPCWTHDLPVTNDGYLYMLLGRTYSTYQFELFKEHPIYYHDGTSLRQYVRPDLATTSNPGLMSAADKTKLDAIDPESGYELPIASASTLGGVKVGTNLSINSTTGVLSATDTTYTNGNGISLSGTTFSAAFPSSGTPAALGTASNGSANTVARSDHVHAKPAYGNITTDGAITSDTAVANGDKIIVADSSASSKLIRTGISFDGSTTTKALTLKGTWESFAGATHNHAASDINSGTLPAERGGTGETTLNAAANSFINSLTEGTAAANRNDYIVAQYTGGGTSTKTYHRRKLLNIFAALNSSDITTALGYTPPQQDTTYSNGNGISLTGTTFSAAFPSSGTPAALGTASNGTSNNVARADHVHANRLILSQMLV